MKINLLFASVRGIRRCILLLFFLAARDSVFFCSLSGLQRKAHSNPGTCPGAKAKEIVVTSVTAVTAESHNTISFTNLFFGPHDDSRINYL